jgi:arylsulfatase A-like enzyme
MNPHTSVRKVVRLPARVALNLSRLACGLRLFLTAMAFTPVAHAQIPATPAPSRPLSVILVLRDQTRYELQAAAGYHMPALDRLAQQGITFRNHYSASAMCTPSRAALYSGQPPQINGVFDQMEAGYVPSLPKDRPNMGSMMKKLGYRTAFYGKWEMDFDILPPKPTVNSSDALQPYGFDIYQPDGDKTGTPDRGYLTELQPKLNKRGFLSFAFDGQYKFARYYSPANFNTPETLEQILRNNDLQLFDLMNDPLEVHNLALDPEKNKDVILRMNALLNQLIAKEVGKNDGSFLAAAIRPKPQ